MKKTIFLQDENAVWLKGNIHSHTVFSDGSWTPEQMKDEIKNVVKLFDEMIPIRIPAA